MGKTEPGESAEADMQKILRVSFVQRLVLSFVQDIDQVSFLYRSDGTSVDGFLLAVRDRADAIESVLRGVRVRNRLLDVQTLVESDVLHHAADRVAGFASDAALDRLLGDVRRAGQPAKDGALLAGHGCAPDAPASEDSQAASDASDEAAEADACSC